MFINCTLVIQAGNFLIAYIILRKFIFKPVMHEIRQERHATQELQLHIQSMQILIGQCEQEKRLEWQVCQQKISGQIPAVGCDELFIFSSLVPPLRVHDLDSQQLQQLEHEVAHSIIKKVERIHA